MSGADNGHPVADRQHLPGCDGSGAGCWVALHPKCPCCGEPMGNDTGRACSFCIAWGCAADARHGAQEPMPADPWLEDLGPIGGGA